MQLRVIVFISIFLGKISLALAADFTNHLGTEFNIIEPKVFFMGSCSRPFQNSVCPAKEGIDIEALPDELPQHKVTIAQPFEISVYEITFEQFQPFAEQRRPELLTEDFLRYNFPKGPVVLISWEDVQAYIKWLNETKPSYDKGIYRLPSESEWEYAARGGSQTIYWWGNEKRELKANCDGCDNQWGPQQILPVGSLPANPYGLHEVLGNVSEWVQDCWNDSFISAPTNGAAWQTGNCLTRVIRGGAYNDPPWRIRVASRDWRFKNVRDFNIGFRLVRQVQYRQKSL